MTTERPHFDSLLPAEMAGRAEDVGVRKADLEAVGLFALAFLAGAFISLGAIFATTVGTGAGDLPYGVGRLLAGLAFSLGLILVIVGGAELFTGNNLIVMAWASRKVTLGQIARNWTIVYVGNLAGALATVVVMVVSEQYTVRERQRRGDRPRDRRTRRRASTSCRRSRSGCCAMRWSVWPSG